MAQRLMDVVGAVCGLIVFGPAMAAITAAVLLDDGRPVLFRQERLGYGRRPFTILKFRSMRNGQVTRVGRVLRATGLDELPQFINILRGDMSAVGPRPLTEADVQRLGWAAPECNFRWQTRPGLTGLAQMIGGSPQTALELDQAYLARRSPWLDCQLIALSFAVNVLGKARVQRRLQRSKLTSSRPT